VTSVQQRIAITDSSQVGAARRAAMRLAADARLDEERAGRVAIVASELATNLVRHAVSGEILLGQVASAGGTAVEIVAFDRGPGMADPERCLRDGFSTNGTSGNGLGAVKRLSDVFDIYSRRGSGTVVVSRIGAIPSQGCVFGALRLPYPGEEVCGDAWSVSVHAAGLSLIVVDGLGHGYQAAKAAATAIEVFEEEPLALPATVIERAHRRMTSTRGGAVAVARYNPAGTLEYGAVGNIGGTLFTDGKSRGLATQNGTVGAQIRHLRTDEYPCAPGSLAVLHSDGLLSRWSLDPYPGLAACHPSVVTSVLYRDFFRGRDDVTVLAVRLGTTGAAR
jgi:anti-sigma regulatory factor (Ser/Thr protein kinase)